MSVSVVHTYRNPTRGRLTPLYDVVWALVWILPAAAIVYGSFFDRDAWLLSSPWWPVLLLIVAGCLLWSWPMYELLFRICYLIRVEDQGSCAFRSPLRWIRLHAQEIDSIRPGWIVNDEGHTVLRYRGRQRCFLVQPIEGFEDFLERVRQVNPQIEVTLEPHNRSG